MLISERNQSLVLVEQMEHARLAGQIAEHWGGGEFAPPKAPRQACLAAALHDAGWRQPDEAPLFNEAQARPLHFLEIDIADHVALYAGGVDEVYAQDPYAGLLVSMHWTGLYTARWGWQSGKVDFANGIGDEDTVRAEEERWIAVKRQLSKEMRRSDLESDLWYAYELLQTWDLLSLYACVADLSSSDGPTYQVTETLKSLQQEPGPRTIPAVPTAPAGERRQLTLTVTAPSVVAVDPYPFDRDEVEIDALARAIPHRRYADAQDARKEIDSADQVHLRCTFTRA